MQTVDQATYLWIAETVIRKHQRALKARTIVSFGLDDGLFGDLDISKTPQKSMQARLSVDIVKNGKNSRFMRIGPGNFYLRDLWLKQRERGRGSRQQADEYIAERRLPPPSDERVLVIPKKAYEEILDFQGVNLDHTRILDAIIATNSLSYIPRKSAETDSSFKQFITYTIIQKRDKILSFRRGAYNRAPAMLRGARCVGFGGHVTEDDLDILSYDDRGMRANAAGEISEEIRLSSGPIVIRQDELEVLGFINDDSSDVGVRHVAVILRYWAPETKEWDQPIRGEASVNQLRWIKTTGSDIDLLDFEYWSQLLLRKFFPTFVVSKPSFKLVNPGKFVDPQLTCVLGSVGSGKSVTTKRLCETAGFEQINTGRLLAGILEVKPVPETPRSVFQELAFEFISKADGPDRLAAAILAEVHSRPSRRVIVDGIRQLRTLSLIRERSDRNVAVVFVYTPPDVAYQMYVMREHLGQSVSLHEFMALYNASVENEVRLMINEADVVIYNWLGLFEYEAVIGRLIEELGLGS